MPVTMNADRTHRDSLLVLLVLLVLVVLVLLGIDPGVELGEDFPDVPQGVPDVAGLERAVLARCSRRPRWRSAAGRGSAASSPGRSGSGCRARGPLRGPLRPHVHANDRGHDHDSWSSSCSCSCSCSSWAIAIDSEVGDQKEVVGNEKTGPRHGEPGHPENFRNAHAGAVETAPARGRLAARRAGCKAGRRSRRRPGW